MHDKGSLISDYDCSTRSDPPSHPAPYYEGTVGEPPANYLVWAILATVLCFWPLGVVSIKEAAKARGPFTMGPSQRYAASRQAQQFAFWAPTIVPVFLVVCIGATSVRCALGDDLWLLILSGPLDHERPQTALPRLRPGHLAVEPSAPAGEWCAGDEGA